MPPVNGARRPPRLAAVFALAAASAGCGGPGAGQPPVDAARAQTVLREALDAWKGGKPPGALADLSPPVRVSDEDWLAGTRLLAYEVSPEGRVVGGVLRCPVSLTLAGRSGRPSKRAAAYDVATSPTPSVVRLD